jgi:hypothetical protein
MDELLPTHDLLHSNHAFSCRGPSAAQRQREIPVAIHRKNYSRMVGIGTNAESKSK